jgi:hypothetical protein
MKAGERLGAVYKVYWGEDDIMPHDISVVVQA